MNKIICSWSFRDSAVWVVPIILGILVYILVKPAPFCYYDGLLTAFGIALGFMLGFRIFWDGGGVRPFLFSRAFSPTRLFLVRWCFGLSVLVLTWMIVALLFASGIRESMQTAAFHNGWFPMIRKIELLSLASLIPVSLIGYQTTAFFVVWYRFLGRRRFKGIAKAVRLALTILVSLYLIPAVIMICFGLFLSVMYSSKTSLEPAFFQYLIVMFSVPAILQTAVMPLCGIFCYKTQEIES